MRVLQATKPQWEWGLFFRTKNELVGLSQGLTSQNEDTRRGFAVNLMHLYIPGNVAGCISPLL